MPKAFDDAEIVLPTDVVLILKFEPRCYRRRNALDLGDVRTFLEVADAGGVSPAARRLGVSKSIVS